MSTVALAPRSLPECEAVIERGLRSFVEVGEALRRIRDERLYRDNYGTFEEYCRERWGFNDRRASQFIQAAEVSTIVETLPRPATESVTRELAPLREEPAALREAWTEAIEQHGPTPTAVQVREVVQDHRDLDLGASDDERSLSRIERQQAKLVAGIASKARLIEELAPHLDFEAIRSLTSEEKEEWKAQLSSARTVLSRVIGAL